MKPLLTKELTSFLKRFGNFVDGEVRSINLASPSQIKLTLAGQDEARGFDWLTIELEFDGVSDASLIDSDKLIHIDMLDGLSITNVKQTFSFKINNSTLFINSSTIKYQEANF